MQRLTSLLHASHKSVKVQRSEAPQNGHPINSVSGDASESSSDEDTLRTHINEQFYADDLLMHGSPASQWIRLLHIDPNQHRSPVSCRLLVSSLQEHPEYDALSYCWGSQPPSPSYTITVNGRPGLCVTKHLLQALQRLRRKDRVRTVWIDAICINQLDTLERNNQVQLMRQIYTQARLVVVWLGELDENQPSCERHASVFDRYHDVCAEPGLSAVEHGNVGRVLDEKLAADKRKSLLPSSFGEVWWKRIWVLQEFAVSRSLPTVYLGPHAVRWQFFADLLWGKENHPFSGLRSERRRSLYTLLSTTYNFFYSTEPRDKIYALLGLVEQSQDPSVIPNYAKSVAEVYEETWYYLLRTEKTLDILLDRRTCRESSDLPSWIPDLSLEKLRKDVVTVDSFQAAGQSQPRASLVRQSEGRKAEHHCACLTEMVLYLRGMHFDTVRQCAARNDCFKYTTFLQTPRVDWEAILDILLSPTTSERFATTDPRSRLDRTTSIAYLLLKYLWEDSRSIVTILDQETRAAGTTTNERRLGALSSMKAAKINQVVAMLGAYARKRSIKLTKTLSVNLEIAARADCDLLRKFTNRPREVDEVHVPMKMRDRTFFSTEHGFVGLGPQDVQKGDSVVILFGASRPFVLRSHGTHHVLVGDAVVPGIMSGQMMALHGDGSIQAEDFPLK
jgi:hypothetical protein